MHTQAHTLTPCRSGKRSPSAHPYPDQEPTPTPPAIIKLLPAAPWPPLLTAQCLDTAPSPPGLGAVGAGAYRHMGCRTYTCAHHVDARKMVALVTAT